MRRVFFGLLTLVTLASVAPVQAASDFASPAFANQWKRDESLVTNFWRPLKSALNPMRETYKEAPGGKRTVQYFDKGRMEVSPAGDITNGLLATELITGELQLGDNTFERRQPAIIPVAGDPDNSFPTYADLRRYMDTNPEPVDQALMIVAPGGMSAVFIREDGDTAVRIVLSDQVGQDIWHNVPQAFAQFRERVGVETVGLAITEPVWGLHQGGRHAHGGARAGVRAACAHVHAG
jgi:hypothetical protein